VTRREARIREHIANLGCGVKGLAIKSEHLLIRHYLPEALPLLVDACRDPNPEMRFRAVWCLGMSRDPSVFETICASCSDPDERVRYDAVMVLRKHGDPRGLPFLADLARRHDPTLPAGLWDFGLAALPYVKQLMRDDDWSVRWNAMQNLGNIAKDCDCRECVELLRSMLADPEPNVLVDVKDWLEQLAVKYPAAIDES
jgi:HEAT repeat protein